MLLQDCLLSLFMSSPLHHMNLNCAFAGPRPTFRSVIEVMSTIEGRRNAEAPANRSFDSL